MFWVGKDLEDDRITITEWVRLEGIMASSGPTSLPEQTLPRARYTGLHPDDSLVSPVRETKMI